MFSNNLLKSLPFIFFLFFLPHIDTDLGWHLRYGEYFLNTGNWLRENEFTYFLPGYRWINPFALYEIIVAFIYKIGGLSGLSLAFALFMTLAFWFYNKMNPKLPLINLAAFLAATALGWDVFALGMRAQIFSFLGIVILLFILQKLKKHPKIAIFLPFLFFLWANTHGGFVLGFAVLGLAIIEAVILMCKPVSHQVWKRSYTSVLLTVSAASSAVATLINPYGVDIYKEVLRHAQYPLDSLIAEWVPPSFEIKVFILVITLVSVFLVANSASRQKFFWISTSILFAILTFKARRFIPYASMISALAIITSHEKWLLRIEENVQKSAVSLLVAGTLILFFWIVPRTLSVDINWKEYCGAIKVKPPCRAVEFIKSNPISGKNVFSAYEWGGFLEWQLPQYKYFVDGRMPAWFTSPEPSGGGGPILSKSPYTLYLEIIQAQPGYQEKLDKYSTSWLLIGAGTFLDIELQNKSKENRDRVWNQIYRDSVAVIYTKLW